MSNDTQPEIRFPGFTEAWEQRKLGEVVESVGTGRSTFTNGIVQTSETPYAVLGSTSVISYDSMFDHSGDFILTARVGANAGNLYKYFGEVKISDNTVYIQANNLDFIYYLLTKYDLKRLSFGTGQPLVKASEVKNLKLNFPQKNEEQQKIGSFFKQLDDTIALHQRKLDLLKETKKGFLQKMFPKNGAKVPEIRFPGFTEDWEQRKLGDITESFSGGTPTAGKSEYYGGDIPFIRSGEISSELTELFITENGLNNSSAKMVKAGDILYALYGATSGEVSISRINGAINQAILAIRPTKNDNSYLIVQWLRKQKDTIISTYLQGGQGNLSGSIVKDLVITLPQDKEEQNKIGAFFKQLDDTIALHQRKLDLLKETKKGFLQKMFV
ncbi:restriction endonuclease subunit S [Enterococcus faecium]|uniref:restriction endonuclease subunit S n=1 Tax=Enterococcus faecium TaxID=1352 RepID=UPI0002A2B449|nr:restriction endonuclease subunit S [Enterococcus faecium]ELB12379.1 hypothetical protein OIK_03217 [Enterococcus faecium EnGen0027]OWZ85324.1 hypothetical protein A5848_002369 [Enterococcus faecium]